MDIINFKSYDKDKIKILASSNLTQELLDEQINHFKENKSHSSLHYKKITCSRAKNRYSIRIANGIRIIMDKIDSETYHFIRLVSHETYNRLTKAKNC